MRHAWAILLAAALPLAANDTAATLGAGGLVPLQTAAIRMESEDLQISVRQIRVRYVFRNLTPRNVDLTVAFPLPEINGAAVANIPINLPARDALNFVDFHVVAGGRTVNPKVEVRSFLEDAEITSGLRALALPLSPLDPAVTAAVNRLSPEKRRQVQEDEWVDCELTHDGKCWPYWRSRIQFYWTQRFPANGTVEVRHTYRPVVGGGLIYRSDAAVERIRPYCGGTEALNRFRTRIDRQTPEDIQAPVFAERQIDYVLTTANHWSGPIRNFRLSVITDETADIAMTCLPGLRRVAATRYELARQNFRPTRDLQLLILQAPK